MSTKTFGIINLAGALAFCAGSAMSAPLPRPQPRLQPAPVSGRADFLRSVPSEHVLFDENGFSLDVQDRAVLDAQLAWLLRNPQVRVTIEGHSEERGTREYALGLADRRANAAAAYLQARGLPASRMTVVSWGKERPAAIGSDESSWARNRRAVTVVPQ